MNIKIRQQNTVYNVTDLNDGGMDRSQLPVQVSLHVSAVQIHATLLTAHTCRHVG